jgi:hypothetical protein
MEQPAIEQTSNENNGVFFIKNSSKTIASLTYSLEDVVMAINHIELQTLHEGAGLGSKLVAAIYEFVKKHGYKVNPLCSFTEVVYDNNPEWSDVRI